MGFREDFEEPLKIVLEINEDTYRGNLHGSIGPAFVYGIEEQESYFPPEFPELNIDSMREETAIGEKPVTVEDWLLTDEENNSHYLVQGKSYGNSESDLEFGRNQLYDFAAEFRTMETDVYDNIEDMFLVVAHPSGVKNPRTDFSKVENGIEKAVSDGEEARIAADVYRFQPPSDKDYPFEHVIP
ncbi:hypothetical protein [Candidatus Nanohalococcus occultus]